MFYDIPWQEISLFFQIIDDFFYIFPKLAVGCIDGKFWVFRCLVRIIDTGEVLDDTLTRLLIEPLGIPLFAYLKWCRDVNFDVAAMGTD